MHVILDVCVVPRITTTIKMGTRIDRDQRMDDKINSVKAKLE